MLLNDISPYLEVYFKMKVAIFCFKNCPPVLSIYSVVSPSHLAAAQPPAGDPHDLEGPVQPARQGAAAVPLAGVHPAPGVASADHGGEQRLGGGGVVRQTLGQTGVRARASNKDSHDGL